MSPRPGDFPKNRGQKAGGLERRDRPGLEEAIARLTALPPVAHEAEVFRARAHLIRGNPTEALATIDRVLAVHPRHFPALFVRAKILFEEGRDWAAVEQALRAVLDVAPNNAEARQNLEAALRHTNHGG